MAIVYPAAINRGKRLMKELHDVLESVGIADNVIASLDTNYYPQAPWETEPDFSDVVTNALNDANVGMSGWRFVCVYSLDKIEPPAHQFMMSPPEKAIMCLYVKKENDRNDPRDRLWFSEVMFRAWEIEAARVLSPIRELEMIWHVQIENVFTQAIMAKTRIGRALLRRMPSSENLHPTMTSFMR